MQDSVRALRTARLLKLLICEKDYRFLIFSSSEREEPICALARNLGIVVPLISSLTQLCSFFQR